MSLIFSNDLFIWIPCSVSDGMSNSNSIINHHFLMSLFLYIRNFRHLLEVEIEKEDLIMSQSFIHTLHYQYIWFSSINITSKCCPFKSDGLKLSQISFIIHSIIHTLKYYWMTIIECFITYFNTNERRKIRESEWLLFISSYFSLNHNWFYRIRNLFHLINSWYPEYWWIKR